MSVTPMRASFAAVCLVCGCMPQSGMSHVADALPDATMSPAKTGFSSDAEAGGSPFLLPLRRESVPVRRNGEVVSFKTSYSGVITVGGSKQPQDFRVVFDTGSGQVVLPSAKCESETCLAHKRYNISQSEAAKPVNVDGSIVKPGELCDEVTIGYGTGEVVGEFSREAVCLGGSDQPTARCATVDIVMAIEMTPQPFRSFKFDGIVGLALESLSLTPTFSFFRAFSQTAAKKQFAFYLSDGHDGETSEIALGGYNSARISEGPLNWAPIKLPEMGYWQVGIKGFRIGNHTLDFCSDGSCRGVVDTGSSHLGIPGGQYRHIFDELSVLAGDVEDCGDVEAPIVEILLDGFSLRLNPKDYMRKLPLAPGINPGSAKGVIDPAFVERVGINASVATESPVDMTEGKKCKPRMMPVNLPAPMGPNFFILGEPVLHRYYTVYDSEKSQIGFGLAKPTLAPAAGATALGDEFVMVQLKLTVRVARRGC